MREEYYCIFIILNPHKKFENQKKIYLFLENGFGNTVKN